MAAMFAMKGIKTPSVLSMLSPFYGSWVYLLITYSVNY